LKKTEKMKVSNKTTGQENKIHPSQPDSNIQSNKKGSKPLPARIEETPARCSEKSAHSIRVRVLGLLLRAS
jgi:hypothetical protein